MFTRRDVLKRAFPHTFGWILVMLLTLTPMRSSSASASPSSPAFHEGASVQVGNGAYALNVRYGPGLNHGVVTVMQASAVARVIDGPAYVDGYPWYQVTGFDSYGSYGWSYGGYLVTAGSYQEAPATRGRAQVQRQTTPTRRAQPAQRAAPITNGPTYGVLATAYNGAEFNSNGIMRNGNYVHWGAVAVDPNVIPLGTRMHISGFGDQIFTAEDTGSAIKGYRIDIWMPSVQQALEFGVQERTVTIIR